MNNNCNKCNKNNIIKQFFCCISNEKVTDLCDNCREEYFILFPGKKYVVTKRKGLKNILLEYKKFLYNYLHRVI